MGTLGTAAKGISRGRGILFLASWCLLTGAAGAVSFNRMVSLGDSLLDDPEEMRSPVVAEHLAEQLGISLIRLAEFGSTSSALLDQGQHTQAAVQFGPGDLAVLWVGGNDFFYSIGWQFGISAGYYDAIDTLEENVDTILGTLRGAGMDVLMLNLPNISEVPFTDSLTIFNFQLRNVAAATVEWNSRLKGLAAQHGAAVVDVFELFADLTARPGSFALRGNVPVLGGDYGCQFCVFADSIHPGAYAQGYIANAAIETVNSFFGTGSGSPLVPLVRTELALLAGIEAADFDGSLTVGASDLSVWHGAYAKSDLADADGDADSDGADFLVWQRQLHPQVAAWNVPEPASIALLVGCIALMVLKRTGLLG